MRQNLSVPVHDAEIIYPCPFSKGYGMPAGQAWQLLKIYYIYRLILSSSFCLLFYFQYGPSFLGSMDSGLYIYTSLAYSVLTIWLGFCLFFRWLNYSVLSQLLVLTDIVTLTLLMHASGGIASGMGILVAVSIAAGGLLIGGRCAVVLAALASVFILSAELYANLKNSELQANYTYTGMLGASYFAIALLSMIMAKRSEQMQVLAGQQQKAIVQLEELNQYIIQHLQSGLIIIDENEKILMSNRAALKLINVDDEPEKLDYFSHSLSKAFQDWRQQETLNQVMIRFDRDTEIQCRFLVMPTHYQDFYLITLEDTALYNQRVQQSKLASLGRLTASIAHEIRNPLGAIGHAGQLLYESDVLTEQDRRLTQMIQSNTQRVNQIIEDILGLSKRNDSNRESIALKQWLAEYLENFYVENSGAESFRTEVPEQELYGFIDPAHLKQIMDNLCQNALRYGMSGQGGITIKLVGHVNGPCFEVIDSGPGIAPEHIALLFEPFFTTSASGTGLGLYISRELAELNQAKLSYHVTGENHCCFSLCLADAQQTTIEI
jgi:two-component system, NtrC family, sensor histidine kinase PilS